MDSQDRLVEETVRSLGRIKQIGKEKDELVKVSSFISLFQGLIAVADGCGNAAAEE